MTRHAMAYVLRAEKVLAEHTGPGAGTLAAAKLELTAAECALVRAYGTWRDGMKQAADEGNELAARYLRESEWDLT